MLAELFAAAAAGQPPPADGGVTVVPAPGAGAPGVWGFTNHGVVAVGVDDQVVRGRIPHDGGIPLVLHPSFLLFLSGWLGVEAGSTDVLLAHAGAEPVDDELELWRRDDLADQPRVARAAAHRTDVAVYGDRAPGSDPHGVLVLGRGVAGRWEAAFEVVDSARGHGLGRRLAGAARGLTPSGAALFVQVAAGNAASLRAVMAAGFRPIAGEVLFAPAYA